MTDDEIISDLQEGYRLTFGVHGRNMEVVDLMARLEKAGLIRTEDLGLSQETRRGAIWISEPRRSEAPQLILDSLTGQNQPEDQVSSGPNS